MRARDIAGLMCLAVLYYCLYQTPLSARSIVPVVYKPWPGVYVQVIGAGNVVHFARSSEFNYVLCTGSIYRLLILNAPIRVTLVLPIDLFAHRCLKKS